MWLLQETIHLIRFFSHPINSPPPHLGHNSLVLLRRAGLTGVCRLGRSGECGGRRQHIVPRAGSALWLTVLQTNAHFISPSSILRAPFSFHLPFDGNRLLIRCSFRQALLRSSLKQKMFDKRVKISREIQSFAFKKWEEQTWESAACLCRDSTDLHFSGERIN